MRVYLIIVLLFFVSYADAQKIIERKFQDTVSGMYYTEVSRQYKWLVPVKDVFFVVDTLNQEETIVAVKEFIKKEDIDDMVFYFLQLPANMTIEAKEKAFDNISNDLLSRKKMVESDFYAIVQEDITDIYRTKVEEEWKTRRFGYPRPLRDTLVSNRIGDLLKFIVEKDKIPPGYYD
ncbi:hypothetical protein [Flavobacterium litorale]|uniref:Uncharacterized protein n=1 Tax=Flavobacterium litorale TaxID=2856519 RepID=A0ABX8V838_9FLAO|nr:hypothetical protein [Flavobacterium litorale]QYJ67378.1 hypothetical protein K1I41_07310 [Flavobacterium litorale]